MNNGIILYLINSEGINVNNTSASKECDIYHYWYFFNKGFKLQPYVPNRCHDLLLMMSMNLIDIAILKIKNINYRCFITEISQSYAIQLS